MKSSKLLFVSICFFIGLCFNLYSQQNDPILLTIAGENITKSEFLRMYQKNNIKGDPLTKEALEEYLDLYINFKLKVKEAERLGLDTVKSFRDELEGYRRQLTQPYFNDKTVDSLLILEAYNRSLWDIRASHILIKLDPYASPKDTLEKYNQIMALRKRILKGESFEKIAKEASEDPSARDKEATDKQPFIKGNAGDLGYFTVFDLVYPFETAAYNLKVGEVSMPVRTDFGYHLIKVYNKKKALGKAQVAHIFISIPKNATKEDSLRIKNKVDSLYNAILNGANFEDIAREFSDDKGSSTKGGVLPWFGCFRMVPEFIVAISELKNKGDMPKPVLTSYGWHIIKLIDKKEIGSYEDSYSELKAKVQRDSRSNKSKDAVIQKIKKDYNFTENKLSLKDFYKVVTDSIFKGKWDVAQAAGLNKIMFTIGNETYTQQDFVDYLDELQKNGFLKQQDIEIFINKSYDEWVKNKCIEYEDKNLESKYPEFKALMKEYRDGILLFDLTDQKVWSKAVKDTLGLKDFYEKHKYEHMWKERVDAIIYTCANESIAKSTRKLLQNAHKKGITNDSILKIINKGQTVLLEIKSGKFQKGDNEIIDKIQWKTGLTPNMKINDKIVFVDVKAVLPPQPKELKEIRGLITADYQKYLDEEWIKELRSKYNFTINKEVLNSIIEK